MPTIIKNTYASVGTYDFQHMDSKAYAMELTQQVPLQEVTYVVIYSLPLNIP